MVPTTMHPTRHLVEQPFPPPRAPNSPNTPFSLLTSHFSLLTSPPLPAVFRCSFSSLTISSTVSGFSTQL